MKKYVKENIKSLPFTIVVFIMLYSITTFAAEYLTSSKEVKYDNSKSSLAATNVQDAIEELNTNANNYTSVVERLNNFGKEMYPVGSIYISVSSTNPQTIFGGTWVSFGEGRTIIGVGSGTDANSTQKVFTANEIGGEYIHTLTVDEMPIHDGHISPYARPDQNLITNGRSTTSYYAHSTNGTNGANYGWVINHSNEAYPATLNAGGSQSHNNIQPYITVYMWKRTS